MAPETFVERALDLPGLIRKKSHFLFGPRQTGKSFLIRHTLPGVRLYDLLDHATYLALSQRPGRIAEELTATDRVVVIDEIQRLPELLNEVHRLIEERGIKFLLTGSSARKLRRGGVNLLGGRARTRYLHPADRARAGPPLRPHPRGPVRDPSVDLLLGRSAGGSRGLRRVLSPAGDRR